MKNVVKQIRNLFKHETKEPTAKFKCTKAQKAYRYGEISLRPPYAAHPSTFGRWSKDAGGGATFDISIDGNPVSISLRRESMDALFINGHKPFIQGNY